MHASCTVPKPKLSWGSPNCNSSNVARSVCLNSPSFLLYAMPIHVTLWIWVSLPAPLDCVFRWIWVSLNSPSLSILIFKIFVALQFHSSKQIAGPFLRYLRNDPGQGQCINTLNNRARLKFCCITNCSSIFGDINQIT